jgi:hypothetical protein
MDGHQSSGSLAALLLGVGLLGGCSADPLDAGGRAETAAFGRAVEYEAVSCWFEAPSEREVSCGWLAVPDDWAAENSRAIHLPVVVFRAASGGARQEPVLFLNGGRVPGVVSKASKRSLRGLAFSVMSSGRVSGISSCWRKEGRTGRTPTVVPAAVVSRDPRGCGRGCGPSGRLAAKSRQDYPDMPAAARSERIPARCI